MEKDIKNLVHISKQIGLHPDFVQGGGGNTSVKITDDLMAIKASGSLLKNMSENQGFALVNHKEINHHITDRLILRDSEDTFSYFLKDKTSKIGAHKSLKPSIETGFHALLDHKYIVHTHSVYANILNCTEEGKEISKKLFPNSIWVDYANPGKDITIAISESIKNKISDIIFMQNHGIIICASTAEEAYKLHQSVNDKIIKHFNISPDYKLKKIEFNLQQIRENVLFPDQIVYLLSEDLINTDAGIETLYSYDYIMNKINKFALTPHFITKKDIDYIKNMESEKYRKSLIRKAQ